MRAVGASSRDVGLIFMGEGLLRGVVSWVQAVPLSILAGRPFVQAIGGIIQFPGRYQLAVNGLWIWLGIVLVLSLAASWLPARRGPPSGGHESRDRSADGGGSLQGHFRRPAGAGRFGRAGIQGRRGGGAGAGR